MIIDGLVIKSTGSWYEVQLESGEKTQARLKGLLRLDESKDTNPVAVGDKVSLDRDPETSDWMITGVHNRLNYIVRSSPKHKGARQVIAANLDQCLLICTIDAPRTSTGFIDRFLMAAEAYRIPTIIVFNKQDLLDEKSRRKQSALIEIYSGIGYEVLLTSASKDIGIAALSEKLMDKTTLIFGHSGVGKSSLMNKIDPSLNLRTGGLSRFANRGMHTTTFAEMFFLSEKTKIIDTPGVREFGHLNMAPEEVSHYFAEMRELLPKCKFNNCKHTDEPNCAVKDAWMNHLISEERYKNYLNIYEEIKANYKHWE
jgi:ribosome biogenesis GTPase / thiamine phosphate phosphatase